MKKNKLLIASVLISMACNITSFAGTWQSDNIGYWWKNDDGTYPTNSWQWLDGNNDGVSEAYYFDSNGYCLINTTTPDGQNVNENGALIINGVVQTQTATANITGNNTSTNNSTPTPTDKKNTNVMSGIASSPYDGYTIVVNMSTKKYHTDMGCRALKKMNDANKGYANDMSYLNVNGYSHCLLCQ